MADVNITLALAGVAAAQAELAKITGALDGMKVPGENFSKTVSDAGESMTKMGAKATLATAPILLMGKSLLDSAGEYEAAMNKLQASTDATSAQMGRVSEAAKQIGSETIFSAGEAVQGFQALATTGVTLQQAFDGVMDATVCRVEPNSDRGTDNPPGRASRASTGPMTCMAFSEGTR